MSDRIAVLHDGACVQCDAPERLFRRPRTRFVAGFFRGCNILAADLAACEPGRARVTIGGAPVMVSLDGVTLPEGSRLAVALRAEHVRVGRAAAACQARLDAVLVEVIYRGTNVDHVLELPDGQRLVATSTQREAEGAGQPIACGFDAGDVILLER